MNGVPAHGKTSNRSCSLANGFSYCAEAYLAGSLSATAALSSLAVASVVNKTAKAHISLEVNKPEMYLR
jgi:hypothetical protein